jgi:hypothetical protein
MKYIDNLTINKLLLEWEKGIFGEWVGTALNVEVSSGIYRLFVNLIFY